MNPLQQPVNQTSSPEFTPTVSLGADPGGSRVLNPSHILLLGCAGAGKTSFANVASGSDTEIGTGVRSTSREVLTSQLFYVDQQPIILIDFPGFNDAHLTGMKVLESLADWLTDRSSKNHQITGFLYMHKITDTRVGGASLRSMNAFKALCGTDSLKNVVYVTNMWSDPPTHRELKREEELREEEDFFGWPISQGAQMARHTDTKGSAHNIIRLLLSKEPTVPNLAKQLVNERLALEMTDAALALEQGFQRDNSYQQHQPEVVRIRDKGLGFSSEGRLQPQKASGAAYPPTYSAGPLSDLRITIKGQGNELERFERDADRMDKSWSDHQKKSKQWDEQIERHIADIGSLAPASHQDRSTSWRARVVGIVNEWGCGAILSGLPERNPVSGQETSALSQADSRSATHQAPRTEYVRPTFQPPIRPHLFGNVCDGNMML